MDEETIDLIDPLDEICKGTSWSPQSLRERLSILKENCNKKEIRSEEIVYSQDVSNDSLIEMENARDDIIEVSDDEERNEEIEQITEVQVIEVDDSGGEEDASNSEILKEDLKNCLSDDVELERTKQLTSNDDQQFKLIHGLSDESSGYLEAIEYSFNLPDDEDDEETVIIENEGPIQREEEVSIENASNKSVVASSNGNEAIKTIADEATDKVKTPKIVDRSNVAEEMNFKEDASKSTKEATTNDLTEIADEEPILEDRVKESNGADPEESTNLNLEELRQNLKLQLFSLRMRKKRNILQNVKQTTLLEEKTHNNSVPIETKKSPMVDNSEEKHAKEDTSFAVLPETTMLKTSEREQVLDENQEDDNMPNVFNEIRKIIRKPKSAAVSVSNVQVPAYSNCPNRDEPKESLEKIKQLSESIKESVTNETSSPFVSDSLDEFLVDSKLNVSYAIPKCGAEEGLRSKDYSIQPVVPLEAKSKTEEGKFKEEKEYKPKTLAEKRKIMEQEQQKKRLTERRYKKLKIAQEIQAKSFVLFKDNKIFVPSKSNGKCLASIESSYAIARKHSLLELYRKTSALKYKPGPLSKKSQLQHDYSEWSSEVKTMPKVVLSVRPRFGQKVHPNLVPYVCRTETGQLNETHVDFALTALGESPNGAIFDFDLRYEKGQEKLLVRRKVTRGPIAKEFSPNNADANSLEEDVSSVINNLIAYVEIKEAEPALIKEDEDFTGTTDKSCNLNQQQLNPMKRKRTFRKLSRTSKELLRLNCKLIGMDAQSDYKVNCKKPYCRLGCVCESISCQHVVVGLHCRKIGCIFGCSCPKETTNYVNVNVPKQTELLSLDVVSRIEDLAKRHLAKEEKEFTQTIIYDKGNTIMVGAGSKPRRATNAPKKYSDFIDDEPFNNDEEKKRATIDVKPCSVSMETHDFSNIIPFCLVHHLYNCHCEGRALFNTSNEAKGDTVNFGGKRPVVKLEDTKSGPAASRRPFRRRKSSLNENDYVLYDSKKRSQYETPLDRLENSLKKRRFEKQNFDGQTSPLKTEQETARIGQDDPKSKTEQLVKNVRKRKQQLQVRKEEPDETGIDKSRSSPKVRTAKRKRAIRSVFPGEIIVTDSKWIKEFCKESNTTLNTYARILPWTSLLKGFLSKTINVYCLRDAPLGLLLNTGPKITGPKIWDIETKGNKILETPLKFTAEWLLKQSELVCEIVKWLITGTLSPKHKAESLSFFLVETVKGQYEVRGLCTQTIKSNDSSVCANGKRIAHQLNKEPSDDITEIKHKNMKFQVESLYITKEKFQMRELIEDGCEDDLSDTLYMWVGLPEVSKMGKWRVIFLRDDFVYLHFKRIDYSIKYTDLVKLTEMAGEEKYTLLVRNLQIRRNHGHTLFGIYVSPQYGDRIFVGPYLVDHVEEDIDTIKYMNTTLVSNESLEKMRGQNRYRCGHWMYERSFKNKKPKVALKRSVTVKIELSNNAAAASSAAVPSSSAPAAAAASSAAVPSSSARAAAAVSLSSAPATASTSSAAAVKSTSSDKTHPKVVFAGIPRQTSSNQEDNQIIMHNGFSFRIKNTKPRAPTEFNRYIITNIPHFGYLGAYQPSDSSFIEVSWPFEKKVLQFDNADNARDFLQERFNQLMQPVPETFKIQVIVLIRLDLTENKPINSEILNGQYICGYFGTHNYKDLTEEFCLKELKLSKHYVTSLIAKRAQEFIRKKIIELAAMSGLKPTDGTSFNTVNILNQAKNEIKRQEALRKKLIEVIQKKENMAMANIQKVYDLIKDLPAKDRNVESRILNDILQIRPRRLASHEVIEIKDDDTVSNENLNAPSTSQEQVRRRRFNIIYREKSKNC